MDMEWPLSFEPKKDRFQDMAFVRPEEELTSLTEMDLTLLLKERVRDWIEADLLQLCHILRQTSLLESKDVMVRLIDYYQQNGEKERMSTCLGHLDAESFDCGCEYCMICHQTSVVIGDKLAPDILQYLMDKVLERIDMIVTTTVKSAFKEEQEHRGEDYAIAFRNDFRAALPLLVCLDFEKFFRGFYYEIGVEMCLQIVANLSALLRGGITYASAYKFVTVWIDVVRGIFDLSKEMGRIYLNAFNWKLKELKVNIMVLMLRFLARFLRDSDEFRIALSCCCQIVKNHRDRYGTRKGELSLVVLQGGLISVDVVLKTMDKHWESVELPFPFEEPSIPAWNVFRMSDVQFPFPVFRPYKWQLYRLAEEEEYHNSFFVKVDREALDWDKALTGIPLCEICITARNENYRIRVHRVSKSKIVPEPETSVRCREPLLFNDCSVPVSGTFEFVQPGFEPDPAGCKERARFLSKLLKEGAAYKLFRPSLIKKARLRGSKTSLKICRRNWRSRYYGYRERRMRLKRQKLGIPGFARTLRGPRSAYYVPGYLKFVQRHSLSYQVLSLAFARVAHSLDLCNDNDTESYVMGVMQVSTGSTLFGDLVAVQKERIGRREMLVKKMSLALNTLYEYLYFEDYFDKDLLNDSRNPYFMAWLRNSSRHVKKREALQERVRFKSSCKPAQNVTGFPGPGNPTAVHRNSSLSTITGEGKDLAVRNRKDIFLPQNQEPDGDTDDYLHFHRVKCNGNGADTYELSVDDEILDCTSNERHAEYPPSDAAHSNLREIVPEDLVSSAREGSTGMKRPKKSGLPVNSGYAKTRQLLREKLNREKAQNEPVQIPANDCIRSTHSNSNKVSANPNSSLIKQKKVPAEVVTTNTVPLPTEDVDVLVSMIEGTHIGKTEKGPEATDPKKSAKKARQREKKRLEEEAIRKAEEERLRQEEEARIREEAAAREEELRKKREKKKKRKNKRKAEAAEAKEINLSVLGVGADISSSKRNPVTNNTAPASDQPSKPSEMVTIRRHPTAPDTTVTISVKSETGGEDLLYTLVNGQVYTEGKTDKTKGSLHYPSLANPSPSFYNATSEPGKGKDKKKKGVSSIASLPNSASCKQNGHPNSEETVQNYERNWFGSVARKMESPSPTMAQRVGAVISPVLSNGATSQMQTPRNNGTGKPFSFLDFEGDEIDLSKLKLPPGITITKLPAPATESDEENSVPMPPPGAGLYNIESNMIVMNPDRDVNDDEEEYNSDDYFFHGKQKAVEFEMVLSNKEKRKRSKASKCDDPEGNGSSERAESRELTPGATGILSTGKASRRGSDATVRGSTPANPKSDRREGRRLSATGKSNGANPKVEGSKDGNVRKGRKGQHTQAKQTGTGKNPSQRTAKPQGEKSNLSTCGRVPSVVSNSSYHGKELPRTLPKITPMNSVKMADVVSGVHNKVSRDSMEISPAKVFQDIPAIRPMSARSVQQVEQSTRVISGTKFSAPRAQSTSIPSTSNGFYEISSQARPEPSRSNSPFNSPSVCGDYNLWSSTPTHESIEMDHSSSGRPEPKPENSFKPLETLLRSTRVWPWISEDETSPPPQGPIRRPTPPYSSSPVFRTSPLAFNLGTTPDRQSNLNFQFGTDQVASPLHFVTGSRNMERQSPLPFPGRSQQSTPPAYCAPAHQAQSAMQYQSYNPFRNDARPPGSGSSDSFGFGSTQLMSQNQSRPAFPPAQSTFNADPSYAYSNNNIQRYQGPTANTTYYQKQKVPYLLCPIRFSTTQQPSPSPNQEPPAPSSSQYTLF